MTAWPEQKKKIYADRDRKIYEACLMEDRPSFAKIGKQFGITSSRVQQIFHRSVSSRKKRGY